MKIDALASEPHYREHILPIWARLDMVTERGEFHNGTGAWSRARPTTPVLVASWRDARRVTRYGRPCILMEHGAGQSYVGTDNPSYVGSSDRKGVSLYLAPSERAAEIHRAAHPKIPVEVVGCPKLDEYLKVPCPADGVAIAHHWNCNVVPETTNGWSHFHSAYPSIAQRYRTLGHAHPRASQSLSTSMKRHGLLYRPHFIDVVADARVLVVDNSSIGAEWMALDRPIIWLNPPQYRRDVNHGGRFWDWAAGGLQVDHPDDLNAAIAGSLACDPMADARRKLAPTLYANLGSAAHAAAAAIRSRFFD